MKRRNGICVAGNMIVDITYPIDVMPKSGDLVSITGEPIYTTGGALNNVIVDLARLDPALPLKAIGRIGTDAQGELVKRYLSQYPNIDTSAVIEDGITSFTLVMSENISHQRSFFVYGGSSDRFTEDDIDWDSIDSEILHIGYILLLKSLDAPDDEYGTKMARLLAHAKEHGLKTSIDVVTENGTRFTEKVIPAMKYTDYCIINEVEAQETTGIRLRDPDGSLHPENMESALIKMREFGVSTWAVIHCPEGGWGMAEDGVMVSETSVKLPTGYIAGTVGAGDAFCSGVLLAAQKKLSLAEGIHLGAAAACASLRMPGATEGMDTMEAVLQMHKALH